MQTRQIARLSNLAGGSLTLLSTLLPWMIVDPNLQFLFLSSGSAWVALVLVLVGGFVSIRSRYGGLMTTLGLVTYLLFGAFQGPRSSFFPVEYSFGPGFWLAWLGAPISLLGLSSNSNTLSLELPRPIRWLIPPLGTLLAVLGGCFVVLRANSTCADPDLSRTPRATCYGILGYTSRNDSRLGPS